MKFIFIYNYVKPWIVPIYRLIVCRIYMVIKYNGI
jgi:hypothetical protein